MFTPLSSSHPGRPAPSTVRLIASVLLALGAACGGGGSSTATGPGTPGTPQTPGTPSPVVTTAVTLQNIKFNPADIQVSPGATVTFTNLDGINHTVTFDNASITSLDAFSSGAKTITMPTAPGTYAYHCTLHANMTGTVLVK